jgi:hypothetical protein
LLPPKKIPNGFYTQVGSEVHITQAGDLIGIVEGVQGILSTNVLANDTFAVKFDAI